MTPSAPRSRLLARLLTVSAMVTAACQDEGEPGATGVIQNGAAGQATSSGGSGQGGAVASAGAGQGGSVLSGSSGYAGSPAAGAAGSESLPPCQFSPCVNEGLCYQRGDEEACAEPDSPEASSQLGCQIPVNSGVYLAKNGAQCCYQSFCGEGRPLYVDGSLTHAATRPRDDWG